VLKLLVAARSNREIARTLGIEERTVKAHVAKLMRKVGVENRIALSIYAVTNSIVLEIERHETDFCNILCCWNVPHGVVCLCSGR
jgi:predicted transcriptional regulator